MLTRSLASDTSWKYNWLAAMHDNALRSTAQSNAIRLQVRYTQAGATSESSENNSVPRGSALELHYTIESNLPFEFDGWLGADLACGDRYYYDVSEDQDLIISPGTTGQTRILTVKPDWPTGSVIIWYGPKSEPHRSVRLALIQEHLTIE